MLTVYGIKQCDTVRKALRWLGDRSIGFQFHDLRIDGFDREILENWLQTSDYSTLLNRRSTTWRQLSDGDKQNTAPDHLMALLLNNPTLVKRPVFQRDNKVIAVGFTAQAQTALERIS